MKAIQIEAFGNPADVVRVIDVPDIGAPAAGEVVIAVEASPINPPDLLMIAGAYGHRPRLPAVMGTEGAGRVVAVGAGVKHLKEGDRTLVPFSHPAWVERVKTNAPWLRPLPPGDANQFAMMGVNPPTAYLLLTDIVKLPRGSWVIQNAANSGVGRATVAIAKSLGLRTVNVVRRAEVVAERKALDADVVLVDEPDLAKRVAEETGGAPIPLALDAVSDTSPMNLMKQAPVDSLRSGKQAPVVTDGRPARNRVPGSRTIYSVSPTNGRLGTMLAGKNETGRGALARPRSGP